MIPCLLWLGPRRNREAIRVAFHPNFPANPKWPSSTRPPSSDLPPNTHGPIDCHAFEFASCAHVSCTRSILLSPCRKGGLLTGPRFSACVSCRTAKVRCLFSQGQDRCNRCIASDTRCIFAQSKRVRTRSHPYARPKSRPPAPLESDRQHVSARSTSPSPLLSPSASHNTDISPPPTLLPISGAASRSSHCQQPLVTADIRARIIAALATLKGKRGAPFSFVTSGDTVLFGASGTTANHIRETPQQQSSEQSQSTPLSLKLSWLLRPLKAEFRVQAGDDGRQPTPLVKMPSYFSSMTLGQTILDPIEGGILVRAASIALFDHFMLEMNAKWEYILDPQFDTHDDVRRRSRLLFATILFCTSKFANYVNGCLVSTTDPFLQSRLCSVARNLVIRAFAEGDRSIETIQALYLLVCWKDPDDDISYLHSGYAFRALHDLDLDPNDGDKQQSARRRRTWLALFRQDKQQSLFFMRRASFGLGDEEGLGFIGDLNTWLKMPRTLPLDFVACCSADLRRIQSKMRIMVQKASSTMLPCLLELMDSELNRWKSTWQHHLGGEGRLCLNDDHSLDQRLLHPGKRHLNILVGLWDHSVRLNIASAILRQSLMANVASLRSSEQPPPSSLSFDLPAMVDIFSTDVPGLRGSVEGACGTLRQLLLFPTYDLRRSPDSVLLLGPSAALFLCLLLCFPCNGILGPSFQNTAFGLIRGVARHVGQSVQSSQDTITLHAAYLDSLLNLLEPSTLDLSHSNMDDGAMHLDELDLQAAHVLAGGYGGLNGNVDDNDAMFNFPSDLEQNLNVQSLANLLDPGFFWESAPPVAGADSEWYLS